MKFQVPMPYRVTTTLEAPFDRAMVSAILQRTYDAGGRFYIFKENERLSNFPQLSVADASEHAITKYKDAKRATWDFGIFVAYEDIYIMFYFYPVTACTMAFDTVLQEDYWELYGVVAGKEEVVPDFYRYINFALEMSADFTVYDVTTTPLF